MSENEENLIENDNNNFKINDSGRPTDINPLEKNDEKIGEKNEIINEDFREKMDINENRDNELLKVEFSRYAFLIVIIFFLLNFINGMHWVTFASCAAKFGKFYHLSNLEVDILSLIFMGVYLITSWFCS